MCRAFLSEFRLLEIMCRDTYSSHAWLPVPSALVDLVNQSIGLKLETYEVKTGHSEKETIWDHH